LDIVLNRRSGVPLREQIAKQLELRIFSGALRAGEKLPSVRALARLLEVHPNTVSAAYRRLEETNHVRLRSGAGVFVAGRATRAARQGSSSLEDQLKAVFHDAVEQGYSAAQIRAAAERLLNPPGPARVAVVDPRPDTLAILRREVKQGLDMDALAYEVREVQANPGLLLGVAITVVFPPHEQAIAAAAPGATLHVVHACVAEEDQHAIRALPSGSTVLVVSSSPVILSFSSVVVRSLRDDDVLYLGRSSSSVRSWKRLASAADLVFADAVCAEKVRRARPRRLRELRLIGESDLQRLKEALSLGA
jgi:GntR family transcriptional regulator